MKELILLKWSYYTKKSIDLVQALSNFQGHLHRNRENNFKICIETQNTPNSASNLKKKKQYKPKTFLLSEFTAYYKATVNKRVWYWHTKKDSYKWERIESIEISPCIHGPLIYNKGEKIVFSIYGAGKTG